MYAFAFAIAWLIGPLFAEHSYAQGRPNLKTLLEIYDLDGDGRLSPSEVALINRDAKIEREREGRRQTPPATAKRTVPPEQAVLPNHDVKATLLVRDQYFPAAFITGGSNEAQKGASFTYTNNIKDQKTTVAGRGAAMLAVYGETNLRLPGSVSPESPRISHFAWMPGIEWDRRSTNGKDGGSVSGRMGLELETLQGEPFATQYLRLTGIYTTDYDNAARIFGAEAAWQPKSPELWLNTTRRVSRDLDMWLGFFPSLNADYYRVTEIGSFSQLGSNRDYLWLGPKANATLYFRDGPLWPFSFYANYYWLYDAINPSSTSLSFLEAGMTTKLTRDGWISLDLRYTDGTLPRTLRTVNEIYAGLNIKIGTLAFGE
jgi:hypothetical protein